MLINFLMNALGVQQGHLSKSAAAEIRANLSLREWVHCIYIRWSKPKRMYVFDIPHAGIKDEPFVAGIPEILEWHLKERGLLRQAKSQGVCALFSAAKLPKPKGGCHIELHLVQEDAGGAIYRDCDSGQDGWLCPNLFQYFASVPATIYIQLR